ncbi:hypothetical protein O0L34_g11752 [Tuta absoluta]|nr:hypothetical protein O0L34_g11752 [Tuta absoluta]
MSFLTKKIISTIPKDVILAEYARYIRFWYINNQLPEALIEDSDIKMFYTPCEGHSKKFSEVSADTIDGVFRMKAYCGECHMSYSKPVETCSDTIHPLKIDWSYEEEKELEEIMNSAQSDDYVLPSSTYSPTLQ